MKKIKKNLKLITLFIVMAIIIGAVLIKYNLSESVTNEISIEELNLEETEKNELIKIEESKVVDEEILVPKNVYVDIKGAVNNPGVYEISEDKKVIDVVKLAGGLTKEADTSMINLAKKVSNEMVIIVYTVDEVKKEQAENSIIKIVEKECVCPKIDNDACIKQDIKENNSNDTTSIGSENKIININNATFSELLTITGIGESKAKAIIEYREENGSFKSKEDIMKVTGIGESLYEKIKDSITI